MTTTTRGARWPAEITVLARRVAQLEELTAELSQLLQSLETSDLPGATKVAPDRSRRTRKQTDPE